jgi:hypothetical protein
MDELDMRPMSREFFAIWKAAGEHLNRQVDGGIRGWLRAHPMPPFREHLSFRLGNQLFFVHVEDVGGRVQGPGRVAGVSTVARMAKGHACRMRMRYEGPAGGWRAVDPGFGLTDIATGASVDPAALASEALIPMSDFELHDFAVQVVRDDLEGQGREILSWAASPEIDPALWFREPGGAEQWVIVRAVRYPEATAPRPANWSQLRARASAHGHRGHFASVAIASDAQEASHTPIPLWRGHGMVVSYKGLEPA